MMRASLIGAITRMSVTLCTVVAVRPVSRRPTTSTTPGNMQIEHFFDEATATLSDLVHDGTTGVVIDPVRDFDPKSGCTAWVSSEKIGASIDREGLEIPCVIDTHVHADPMSGLPFFRERYGAGALPEPESNQLSYLKIPIDAVGAFAP